MVDKKGVVVGVKDGTIDGGNVVVLIIGNKYGRDIGTMLGDDEFVIFA